MSRKPLHDRLNLTNARLEKQDSVNIHCVECQMGVMRLDYKTYFIWLNEELVTVQNFPAWICDVCGRREYDQNAIVWLKTLLNHEAGFHRSASQSQDGRQGLNPIG